MLSASGVRLRWVLFAATVLGLFSTAQGYRLTVLSPRARVEGIELWPLLALNLMLWYVPAALTPVIFWLSGRFRLDSTRWLRSLAVHTSAAFAFSIVHALSMTGVRLALWPELISRRTTGEWAASVQSAYLMNLDWALMTYAAVAALSHALHYYREAQSRALTAAQLETRLVEARLKTLETELHPHFLFNTLHAVSSLVHADPDAADRMISRLSDLLRLTFDRSGAAEISLKEELEFLQKYLQIEQIRFQDRLSVSVEIQPEALDAEVPRLLLQPIVENAITHGIAPRKGPGQVRISAHVEEGRLQIEVRDNGAGLSPKARETLHHGVGLSNTRARLECLYGPHHRLEFVEDRPGLAVRLTLPFRQAARGAATEAIQVA